MRAALSIRWETLDKLIGDGLEDLAMAHWEETEIDKNEVPLALDFERAKVFEKTGEHRTAAVRLNGRLVGYGAWTVTTATFHRSTLHAFCIAIYVEPECRGFGSLALIRWCERELTALGVKKIYIASKTPRQCDLFKKLGYVVSETMHSKLLGVDRERRNSTTALPAA